MKTFVDQTGRSISITESPQRIISLVPSQTELLADLGLNETVIGITKFCVHPEGWFRTKTRIGGTKNLNIERIKSLQPDLIIANKEENEKEQVEELSEHFPVWISDISTIDEAREMILTIGEMTGRILQSQDIIKNINSEFGKLKSLLETSHRVNAAYLIWNNPFMSAGGDTFITTMMNAAGFENIFADLNRYPEVTAAMIKERKPEVIFFSSEPYPFKEKHIDEFKITFGESKLFLVDGEMFSWYGSRLQHAPAYFRKLFEQIQSVS